MYLIRKGEKPKEICRYCRKLHSRKDCAFLRGLREATQEVKDWIRANQARIRA